MSADTGVSVLARELPGSRASVAVENRTVLHVGRRCRSVIYVSVSGSGCGLDTVAGTCLSLSTVVCYRRWVVGWF